MYIRCPHCETVGDTAHFIGVDDDVLQAMLADGSYTYDDADYLMNCELCDHCHQPVEVSACEEVEQPDDEDLEWLST
jgi:hypothetical protein